MKSPINFLSIVAAVSMTFGLSTSTVQAQDCMGDVTHDGTVDELDIAIVLAAWGTPDDSGGADINNDGIVNGGDFVHVIAGWGDCAQPPTIPGSATVRIDLSELDQTGLNPPPTIYMVGYASASGKILQQDPTSNEITIATPQPKNFVVTDFHSSGRDATFATTANLFVGGAVTFTNHNGSTTTTIKSIAANVATFVPINGVSTPTYPTFAPESKLVVVQPSALNLGTVTNSGSGTSIVTGVDSASGGKSGIQLGSIISGSFSGPPAPGPAQPSAQAALDPATPDPNRVVTGFAQFSAGGTQYQNPPTVSFDVPIHTTGSQALGNCPINISTGVPTGMVHITNPGSFPTQASTEIACCFSPPFQADVAFYPCDNVSYGPPSWFPGSTGDPTHPMGSTDATLAAKVTSLEAVSDGTNSTMTIGIDKATTEPAWAPAPPIVLGGAGNPFLNVHAGGTTSASNPHGFARYYPLATVTVDDDHTAHVGNYNTLAWFAIAPKVIVTADSIVTPPSGTAVLNNAGRIQLITFPKNAFAAYPVGTHSIVGEQELPLPSTGVWTVPSFTISDLLSTNAITEWDFQLSSGSSVRVETKSIPTVSPNIPPWPGVQKSGNGVSNIHSIMNYTVTFEDAVPPLTTSIAFANGATATVGSLGTTLVINKAEYQGVASALALGIIPLIQHTTERPVPASAAIKLEVTETGSAETITITLRSAVDHGFWGQGVNVYFPATSGILEAIKFVPGSPDTQYITMTQLPTLPGEQSVSTVDGARIYFLLGQGDSPPPSFPYTTITSVESNGDLRTQIAVTQPPEDLVWSGQIGPFVYLELTANDMPCVATCTSGGDGKVYIDLSAVDGFFFPAALSTEINGTMALMGQPYKRYPDSGNIQNFVYETVTRDQIFDAFKVGLGASKFHLGTSSQLSAEYLKLLRLSPAQLPIGIANPTFAYSTARQILPGITAFETCWSAELDQIFGTSAGPDTTVQIDIVGDITIPGPPYAPHNEPKGLRTYYKGKQVSGSFGGHHYRAIEFSEYKVPDDHNIPDPDFYSQLSATGNTFWVYDPRTPPTSEVNAYINNSQMCSGYQVFANNGVFASKALNEVSNVNVPGGNFVQGASPIAAGNTALLQLLSLQRQIVQALNVGVASNGIDRVTPINLHKPNVTGIFWETETNWYPVNPPYWENTPQNLFSQWVHTAVICPPLVKGGPGTYYATYPFGNLSCDVSPNPACASSASSQIGQDFGLPTRTAGGGPFMNQTYGFAYDESPNITLGLINQGNVPSKFIPLKNVPLNTLDFKLVFGPWSTPLRTCP